jgi:hypoxanthine phosphoribosyltransferase
LRHRPGPAPPAPQPEDRAISPATKKPSKKRSPIHALKKLADRLKAKRHAAKKRAALEQEHPIGMGVADAYALRRLKAPKAMKSAPKKAMREVGWAAFGEIARQLSLRISKRYQPDAVLGIAKGGVFVGSAVAAALGCDFFPVRVEARRRDATPGPEASDQFPELKGKHVLVVDDVCNTGATLAKAKRLARKAGAKEIRTAALVVRPRGARPDFHALETEELVLFGWDYQLDQTDASQELPIDADVPDAEGDPAESGV